MIQKIIAQRISQTTIDLEQATMIHTPEILVAKF